MKYYQWEVFRTRAKWMGNFLNEILILGQDDVLCGLSVVSFSIWFQYEPAESMDFFNCLVASHVTGPGSSPTEPGAVIKFSDFSSHPGTRML